MTQEVEGLKKELERLRKQREIDARALERARVRAAGRRTDPTNKTHAASLSEDLEKLDGLISEKESELVDAEKQPRSE